MSPESLRLATYLADRLDDWKSLRFYRHVAARVPHAAIRDALVATLDLPAGSIRRSRAAYFTSLITPNLRRDRRTQAASYAPPETSPPRAESPRAGP